MGVFARFRRRRSTSAAEEVTARPDTAGGDPAAARDGDGPDEGSGAGGQDREAAAIPRQASAEDAADDAGDASPPAGSPDSTAGEVRQGPSRDG